MSEIRVDNITDEAGTGSPAFPNGNVGIGTSSPIAKLTISDGSRLIEIKGDDGENLGCHVLGSTTTHFGTRSGNSVSFVSSGNIIFSLRDGQDFRARSKDTGLLPAYFCRAWVNFDGTPTTPSVRASANVSSVVRNGEGNFTLNFATAMPDANYAATGIAGSSSSIRSVGPRDKTTTGFTFFTGVSGGPSGNSVFSDLQIFR